MNFFKYVPILPMSPVWDPLFGALGLWAPAWNLAIHGNLLADPKIPAATPNRAYRGTPREHGELIR